MAEYQKKLNFRLKELVPFRADQLVKEIKSASLEPSVMCHEHGQYVILRGKLVFCGEYYPQVHEIEEDFFAEQNVADVFRNNEEGYCTFNYAFPVDITIPQDRILSTDEISIGIAHFDCDVQEDGFVKVSAELFVDGVYDREYVEHVRYQNQVQEPMTREILAQQVTDELDGSSHLENQFGIAGEFTQGQGYSSEDCVNQNTDFRNYQNDDWSNSQHEHHTSDLNTLHHTQNENDGYNESAQNNNGSFDEQITYHTTYDYDPWNHNFNNTNTYGQADYYRNPYDATYQGGAQTQYYSQSNESMESSASNTADDYADQYVTFTPTQKPALEEAKTNDYDIKIIPEASEGKGRDDTQVDYEAPIFNTIADTQVDHKASIFNTIADTQVDHKASIFNTIADTQVDHEASIFNAIDDTHRETLSREKNFKSSPETLPKSNESDDTALHVEKKSPIQQNEVVLDIENQTKSGMNGYDKVVFPFDDDENTLGKNDAYEFRDDTYIQPQKRLIQETVKPAPKELGKSRVVSDFFNARGKEEKISCLKIYIVQPGDSLEMLAEKYAINASKIATFNQIQLSDTILEGQVIYIPE